MQYQVRRAGQAGPNAYTAEQLRQMESVGTLLSTDEVARVGEDMWVPLRQFLASVGGPPAAPAAPSVAPTAATQWEAAAAGQSGDWLMPAHIVRWIFRGCLMGVVASTLLPWISLLGIVTWLGITWWPGILVFLVGGAALGGTWIQQVRPWTFIGGGVCFLIAFVAIVGAGTPAVPGEGITVSQAATASGLGWRGFGMFLCLFASAGAATFGTFAFIQHNRNSPAW